MTKGTKIFRIIICVLLALTMIGSAFFDFLFLQFPIKKTLIYSVAEQW